MNRDGFIFYRSFYEGIKELPRDIQGEVLTAIMEYGLNGATTESLKPVAKAIFTLIKPQIDANTKRFENGLKGGRPPKKETKQKPNQNQDETKPKPKQENEKPKEKVKEKVKVKEKEDKQYVPRLSRGEYFIQLFNNLKGTDGKPAGYKLNDKVKKQLNARIKEGYTSKDFEKAITNCKRDPYHRENGLKYLTPEFITRPDKLELYLNGSNKPKNQKLKPGML